MAKSKNAMTYEAPKAEVILIESQSVLCGSAKSASTAGPGTTPITNNTNTVLVL